MQWILDFDDTLAMGPNTWAFQVVLPDLIKTHDLPFEQTTFDRVMLDAQKRANEGADEAALLNDIFTALDWSTEIQGEMMHRVFNEYQPSLFDDALPFLQAIHKQGDSAFIISNNKHATMLVENLGIADYFIDVLTPDNTASDAKPALAMFTHLQAKHDIDTETIVMIGDDPWSDGSFAQKAGIGCWIIDRLGRYDSLHATMPHHFVTSLADISQPERE